MTTVSRDAQPTFGASALRVFDLSLGQMLWSRRSIFLAAVVASPVALAVAIYAIAALPAGGPKRGRPFIEKAGGPFLFGAIIWLLYIRFIVPVLGVFYGTALIA